MSTATDLLQAALDSINSAKDTIAALESEANALRLRAETAEDVLRTLADKPDQTATIDALTGERDALSQANVKLADKLARALAVIQE